MSLNKHPKRLGKALLRTLGEVPCCSLKIHGELEGPLHNEVIVHTIEAMSGRTHLRELHVQTGFGEPVVNAILAVLKNNKSLAVLSLLADGCIEEFSGFCHYSSPSSPDISTEVLNLLGPGLRASESLRRFECAGGTADIYDWEERELEGLRSGLLGNTSLIHAAVWMVDGKLHSWEVLESNDICERLSENKKYWYASTALQAIGPASEEHRGNHPLKNRWLRDRVLAWFLSTSVVQPANLTF